VNIGQGLACGAIGIVLAPFVRRWERAAVETHADI